MVLVHKTTRKVITRGQLVVDFRGKVWEVVSISAPTHSGSTGRINVKDKEDGGERSFYPGVCDLEWAETGKYSVEITETLQKTYEVEASSESEAISIVKAKYYDQDIVLDDEAYIDTEYNII